MAGGISIQQAGGLIPAAIRNILQQQTTAIYALRDALDAANRKIVTLEELLKGASAPITTTGGKITLPPVANYSVHTFPSYIVVYLEGVSSPSGNMVTPTNPGYLVQMWRGLDSEKSDSAQLVQQTFRNALEDHPPPGETYRYWLRYVNEPTSEIGPFTPAQGIRLVTQPLASPEEQFDFSTGGLFLETFENEDMPGHWDKLDGGTATLTYPHSGVVGGKVLRIDGAEEWRRFTGRFDFDPNILYRMKVGVRLAAAPSNPAKDLFRAGFMCFDNNGANLDTGGGSGFANAHWFCAFDKDLGAVTLGNYQEFTGYLRGLGSTPANNSSQIEVPSVARTGTRYWTPVFVANFDDGNGITEIDYIRVEAVDGQNLGFTNDIVYLDTFDHQHWEDFYDNELNGAALAVTYPTDGEHGGRVIQAAGGRLWIQSKTLIPFDPKALYRITAKIRRTSSSGGADQRVYVGVAGVAADGVTAINEAGANSFGSQHYNCFRGFDLSGIGVNTWVEQSGYFRGLDTVGFGVAAHRDAPTPLRTGVRYFKPLLIMNYDGGVGTEQCDYIRVERLVVPDDSDNTKKGRISPDAEFALASDETFWDLTSTVSGVPTISLTGGIEAGYVEWVGNSQTKTIISKPTSPVHCVAGEFYTVRIRWRRTGTVTTADATIPIFDVFPGRYGPADAVGIAYMRGGLHFFATDVNARTVNEWQQDEAIAMLIKLGSGGAVTDDDLPFISAALTVSSVHSGGTIQVDYLDVVAGQGADPYQRTFTAGTTVQDRDYFSEMVYNSASAGTFSLQNLVAANIGVKVYFRQDGAGSLTIASAGGGASIQSPPNITGSRNLSGRYARAFAEYMGSGVWLLQGSLA